jgi:hypothetical protein
VVDLPAWGSLHREEAVTGKTDLRLGRVPSRKLYRVLFADQDRGRGEVKAASFGETILTAFPHLNRDH